MTLSSFPIALAPVGAGSCTIDVGDRFGITRTEQIVVGPGNLSVIGGHSLSGPGYAACVDRNAGRI